MHIEYDGTYFLEPKDPRQLYERDGDDVVRIPASTTPSCEIMASAPSAEPRT